MYGFQGHFMVCMIVPSPKVCKNTGYKDGSMTTLGNRPWDLVGTGTMYPDRDIPVLQLSVDRNAPPEVHYMIGKELGALRNHNVLIFCSGNIVHNLRMVDWNMENKGYDWAYEFDDYIHDNIMDANHDRIMLYHQAGECAKYSVPIPDHYYPLLYALGASSRNDEVSVYNKACVLGSVTMTSYLWE